MLGSVVASGTCVLFSVQQVDCQVLCDLRPLIVFYGIVTFDKRPVIQNNRMFVQ